MGLLIHNLLYILCNFRNVPGQNIYILRLKFLIEYLLTLIVDGMNGLDDRLHASARLTDHVPELPFHPPYLLQAEQPYSLLEQPPIECGRDLIITKIVFHNKLFIIHLFLNKSCLLHFKHLQGHFT